MAWRITQFGPRLGIVDGIASVVTRTVLDKTDQILRWPASRRRGLVKALREPGILRKGSIDGLAQLRDKLEVGE
jgi:hypothetical protein